MGAQTQKSFKAGKQPPMLPLVRKIELKAALANHVNMTLLPLNLKSSLNLLVVELCAFS